MTGHILKESFRKIKKNSFLTIIQILGLVIGFTIVLFLTEKINYEKSYDKFWTNYEKIYRVALDLVFEDGRTLKSASNFSGASELLDAELSGVVTHCNMNRDVVTVFNKKQKIQDVDWFWCDTTFFKIFERKFIYKETDHILTDVHCIAISETFAKKLFGNENPLNREISVNEGYKFIIKGVFEDIPSNSHLKIDVLGSYRALFFHMRNFDNKKQTLVENPNYSFRQTTPYSQNRWRNRYRPFGYIKLSPQTDISEVKAILGQALEKAALPEELKRSEINFIFQPIASIHLNSKLEYELHANGSNMYVNFLIVIGIVILIVCLINFLNLSIISTIGARKSYSIRLLNGSKKIEILKSLLISNLIIYVIALIISIPIAILVIAIKIPEGVISIYSLALLLIVIAIGVFTTALIPYFSIYKTHMFSILKEQLTSLNQNRTSQTILVVVQFTITIILIISTVGIYKQMNFMMKKELGFSGNQTVFSFSPMTMNNHPDISSKLHTFKNEVMNIPGVKSFSVSSSIPGKNFVTTLNNVIPQNSSEPFGSFFNQISIDEEFLEAYNISLIAGEKLNEQSNWISNDALINKSASEAMGFQTPADAIGSAFKIGSGNFIVKGVFENYHHVSLHHQIQPLIYLQNLRWDKAVGYYSFMIDARNTTRIMREVEKVWTKLYPKEEFLYQFSNAKFEAQYENDVKFKQILTYSAVLALIISCLGLLGLTLFNTKQRIKEIGIRKVNGAKVSEILAMLNKAFVKWIVLAFIIACPVAWFALIKWLENFAYKASIAWWIYALAGFVTMIIALVTVSIQSYRAASKNPVEALRYE